MRPSGSLGDETLNQMGDTSSPLSSPLVSGPKAVLSKVDDFVTL